MGAQPREVVAWGPFPSPLSLRPGPAPSLLSLPVPSTSPATQRSCQNWAKGAQPFQASLS